MRNKKYGFILLGLLIIMVGCGKKEEVVSSNISFLDNKIIEIEQLVDCNDKVLEDFSYNKGTIYKVCLQNIRLGKDGMEEYPLLKETLDTSEIENFLDEITSEMDIEAMLNDGGTALYSKGDLRLLRCHTILGNNDVYFGNSSLKLIDASKYCK